MQDGSQIRRDPESKSSKRIMLVGLLCSSCLGVYRRRCQLNVLIVSH